MSRYELFKYPMRDGWIQPTPEEYAAAFIKLDAPKARLLKIHYGCANQGINSRQLARLANFERFNAANLMYGNTGKEVSKLLATLPPYYIKQEPNWWSLISDGGLDGEQFIWIMRPEAVTACRLLGWTTSESIFVDPSEANSNAKELHEGEAFLIQVKTRERSEEARARCIEHYGSYKCQICSFDFTLRYGLIGERFIHVHHLELLGGSDESRPVNPKTELLPVCPNCHSMLHQRTPPFSPEELRSMLKD